LIELLVLDVDGCLTDGKITYDSNLIESKSFDVKDGLAISVWNKKLNKKSAIITGRFSEIVEKRAKELGITYLYQNIHNKDEILENILKKTKLTWKQVAVIGDDLNDLKMLKKANISFCPNDAVELIKKNVNIVCKTKGGYGAVREMIEYICKYENIEEDFVNLWV